jgi:hypothetical protein
MRDLATLKGEVDSISDNKRVCRLRPLRALRWKPSALSRLVLMHERAPRLGFGNA